MAFDALKAAVEANSSVTASAVLMLQGLAAELREALANQDPAAMEVLVDQLESQTLALAEAVAANTVLPPVVESPVVAAE